MKSVEKYGKSYAPGAGTFDTVRVKKMEAMHPGRVGVAQRRAEFFERYNLPLDNSLFSRTLETFASLRDAVPSQFWTFPDKISTFNLNEQILYAISHPIELFVNIEEKFRAVGITLYKGRVTCSLKVGICTFDTSDDIKKMMLDGKHRMDAIVGSGLLDRINSDLKSDCGMFVSIHSPNAGSHVFAYPLSLLQRKQPTDEAVHDKKNVIHDMIIPSEAFDAASWLGPLKKIEQSALVPNE
jgi:hypothetical protein